jgi:hypothetical protein
MINQVDDVELTNGYFQRDSVLLDAIAIVGSQMLTNAYNCLQQGGHHFERFL